MVNIRRMSRLCFGSHHGTIAFRGRIALDQPILLLLLLLSSSSSSLLSPLCRYLRLLLLLLLLLLLHFFRPVIAYHIDEVVFYNILSFGEDAVQLVNVYLCLVFYINLVFTDCKTCLLLFTAHTAVCSVSFENAK